MVDFYEVLGISVTSSIEEIKAAYRALAQKTHPDRNGGSTEAFQKVKEAYEVLSDDARRAQYDAGGNSDPADTVILNCALRDLAAILSAIIERCNDVATTNVVDSMRATISNAAMEGSNQRLMVCSAIGRLNSAADRVHVPDGGFNILKESILAQVKRKELELAAIDNQQAIRAKMLEILAPYTYDVAGPVRSMWYQQGSTTSTI